MIASNEVFATKQARMLYDALISKGIIAQLEYSDGHKTVDIAILKPKIYIEVDGLNHFTDAEQIIRDFKRSHFSDGDDFSTFYVTNQIIDNHLEEVVNALVEVVRLKIKLSTVIQ